MWPNNPKIEPYFLLENSLFCEKRISEGTLEITNYHHHTHLYSYAFHCDDLM